MRRLYDVGCDILASPKPEFKSHSTHVADVDLGIMSRVPSSLLVVLGKYASARCLVRSRQRWTHILRDVGDPIVVSHLGAFVGGFVAVRGVTAAFGV